jgi:hypothetical protein
MPRLGGPLTVCSPLAGLQLTQRYDGSSRASAEPTLHELRTRHHADVTAQDAQRAAARAAREAQRKSLTPTASPLRTWAMLRAGAGVRRVWLAAAVVAILAIGVGVVAVHMHPAAIAAQTLPSEHRRVPVGKGWVRIGHKVVGHVHKLLLNHQA